MGYLHHALVDLTTMKVADLKPRPKLPSGHANRQVTVDPDAGGCLVVGDDVRVDPDNPFRLYRPKDRQPKEKP